MAVSRRRFSAFSTSSGLTATSTRILAISGLGFLGSRRAGLTSSRRRTYVEALREFAWSLVWCSGFTAGLRTPSYWTFKLVYLTFMGFGPHDCFLWQGRVRRTSRCWTSCWAFSFLLGRPPSAGSTKGSQRHCSHRDQCVELCMGLQDLYGSSNEPKRGARGPLLWTKGPKPLCAKEPFPRRHFGVPSGKFVLNIAKRRRSNSLILTYFRSKGPDRG